MPRPDVSGASPGPSTDARTARTGPMSSSTEPVAVDAAAVARLIDAADHGDARAATALFETLYAELHRIAAWQLRRGGSATLGATTLVHECWLDMAGRHADFPDRARFVAYAARAMRGLVVDYVRERFAQKRGGAYHLTSLDTRIADETPDGASDGASHVIALKQALDELELVDAALAQLVDLKFFCGFSFAEIAAMRDVSERTVQRDWQKARLLLHDELASR